MSTRQRLTPLLLILLLLIALSGVTSVAPGFPGNTLSLPKLTNNPHKDVIATNKRPLLSFFNSTGGIGNLTYEIQIDKVPTFNSNYLIEYSDIPEETPYVTSKRVEEEDELDDKTLYYWRVRAVDSSGQSSPWAKSRFLLNTSSDDAHSGLIRTPIESITASSGHDVGNMIDVGDEAAGTFWEGYPKQPTYRVRFDLGRPKKVSRIWQLCDRSRLEGRPKDYVWQHSNDDVNWKDIPETRTRESDAFRRIIKFDAPITARYFRIHIEGWHGSAPRIHEITFYSPEVPTLPKIPNTEYVLVVANRHDGETYGNIRRAIENSTFDVELVKVPYYNVSLDIITQLEPKPVAIILSGFGRWYENLPMFEFNGEYELIRESKIPILGICGGHQLIVMAHGYTYARDMGYGVYTYKEEDLEGITPINIVTEDPIFEGIPDPFYAPEFHGWEVVTLPDDIEVLAVSDCIEVIKSTRKNMYGEQFHAEIDLPFNEGRAFLFNFLGMALEASAT